MQADWNDRRVQRRHEDSTQCKLNRGRSQQREPELMEQIADREDNRYLIPIVTHRALSQLHVLPTFMQGSIVRSLKQSFKTLQTCVENNTQSYDNSAMHAYIRLPQGSPIADDRCSRKSVEQCYGLSTKFIDL